MKMKSFRFDRGAVAIDASCDMYVEAGIAGGPCHRQAMGHEIPIFSHEIDDAGYRTIRAGCRDAGIFGIWALAQTAPQPLR